MSARATWLVSALLWITLALHTFGGLTHAIGDGDEAFHAVILDSMLQTGHLADARWQGVSIMQRPPTTYWLALPFAARVPGEMGLRLSAALCSFATLLTVFLIARKTFERLDAAWLATLLLAGSPFFHVYTRALLSEPPLVLALAGALLALRDPRGLVWAAAGLGAAVAVKSLAAAIPALVLAPWLVFAARRHRALRVSGRALIVFLVLAVPYYAIELMRHGSTFWNEHVLFHLVKRAAAGYGLGLGASPFAYFDAERTLEGPFVCGWLVLGTVGAIAIGLNRRAENLVLLGSFGLGVFVLVSCVSMKLPHYLLPMHVAAALGAAGCFAQWVGPRAQTADPGLPYSGEMRPLALVLALLVPLAGGVASARYAGGNAWLLQRDQGQQLGALAKAATEPGEPVYAYEWYGPSLGYYAQRRCVLLTAAPDRFKSVNIDFVARANAAMLTPPGPAPAGSTIIIAGPANELGRAPWLAIEEVLGFAEPYFLVRARVRDIAALHEPAGNVTP